MRTRGNHKGKWDVVKCLHKNKNVFNLTLLGHFCRKSVHYPKKFDLAQWLTFFSCQRMGSEYAMSLSNFIDYLNLRVGWLVDFMIKTRSVAAHTP